MIDKYHKSRHYNNGHRNGNGGLTRNRQSGHDLERGKRHDRSEVDRLRAEYEQCDILKEVAHADRRDKHCKRG